MLTRKKSIVSCFVAGALLCTLTSGFTTNCYAAESALTSAGATQAGSESGSQDSRKTSENNKEENKAFIKSTEEGQSGCMPGMAAARIAGASVESGAGDEDFQVPALTPAEGFTEGTGFPQGALSAAEPQTEAQDETNGLANKAVTTVETYLNIRSEASENGEIIGRLYAGGAGEILAEQNGWIQIRSGEVEGWVSADYVVTGTEAETFAEDNLNKIAVIREDGVRVRDGASTDSVWIGVVNADEAYPLTEAQAAETEAQAETEEAQAAETEAAETTSAAMETPAAETTAAETQVVEATQVAEVLAGPQVTAAETTEETASAAETAAETQTAAEETAALAEVQSADHPAEDWIRIEYEDGKEGYVCSEYAEITYDLGVAKSMDEIRAEEEAKAQAEREKAEAEAAAAAEKRAAEKKASETKTSETQAAAVEADEEEAVQEASSDWVSLGEFKITAYCGCAACNGKWAGTTASGATPRQGRTIAVAPWIIPYGSQVKIEGLDNIYVAEDTGGFAKRNPYQIDLFFADHGSTGSWGVRYREVWIKK